MQPVNLEDLKKVAVLADLPNDHLQWILDNAEYHEFEDGTQIKKTGDEADVMFIVIEGKVAFYFDYHGRLVYFFSYSNDITTGGVGGLLPHSRMKTYPGCSFAVGHLRCLTLHKTHFAQLEQLNPEFVQRLIGAMTERAKLVATTQSTHEKVNALGQVAAGMAHELNNPVAAIARTAKELSRRQNQDYELEKQLLQSNITPTHIDTLKQLVDKKATAPVQKIKRTILQQNEYEEAIEDWLQEIGISESSIAETFAELNFSTGKLENIRSEVGKEAFVAALPWFENKLACQNIIKDLADASKRISGLVDSIKSHVNMDRAADLQPTDLHHDIENTLTLIAFKLREKNIAVTKKFCNDLPLIPAYVSELNQIWTNLIDNAIYAVDNNGQLVIETTCDTKNATVCIIDNGSGIPQNVINNIFDPFFTTKKVGEGTGLGLDIVNRAVKRHKGDIQVSSTRGRTAFTVSIPLQQQ